MTSQRYRNDFITMLCVCWVGTFWIANNAKASCRFESSLGAHSEGPFFMLRLSVVSVVWSQTQFTVSALSIKTGRLKQTV